MDYLWRHKFTPPLKGDAESVRKHHANWPFAEPRRTPFCPQCDKRDQVMEVGIESGRHTCKRCDTVFK